MPTILLPGVASQAENGIHAKKWPFLVTLGTAETGCCSFLTFYCLWEGQCRCCPPGCSSPRCHSSLPWAHTNTSGKPPHCHRCLECHQRGRERRERDTHGYYAWSPGCLASTMNKPSLKRSFGHHLKGLERLPTPSPTEQQLCSDLFATEPNCSTFVYISEPTV